MYQIVVAFKRSEAKFELAMCLFALCAAFFQAGR
jgi:hypothetical protein